MDKLKNIINKINTDFDESNITLEEKFKEERLIKIKETLKLLVNAIMSVNTELNSTILDKEQRELLQKQYKKLGSIKTAITTRIKEQVDNYIDSIPFNPIKPIDENSQDFTKLLELFNIFSKNIQKDIEKINKNNVDQFDKIVSGYVLDVIPKIDELIIAVDKLSKDLEKAISYISPNIEEFKQEHLEVINKKIKKYAYRVSFSDMAEQLKLPNIVEFKDNFGQAVKSLMKVNSFDFSFDQTIFTKQVDMDKFNPFNLEGGYHKVHTDLSELSDKFTQLNIQLQKIKILLDKYNAEREMKNWFLVFICSIYAKNKIGINEAIYYKYINKGLLFFYYQIINNILERIERGTELKYQKIIDYFKNYHFYLLVKLSNFLKWILKQDKLKTESVVDIFKCKDKVLQHFLLLNEFKSTLESYNEYAQKQVTIYARINDWGDSLKLNDECDANKKCKIFLPDSENTTILKINEKGCAKYNKLPIKDTKFTEVYDTQNFSNNQIISKYMSLETQLAKGKGLMMLTYGYSGVGKTVTLFGKSNVKQEEVVEGILQSTLTNIKDMKKIFIRVYELYGKGVQYPFYWKKDTKDPELDQELIAHNLDVKDNSLVTINEDNIKGVSNMIKYLETNNYNSYETEEAEQLLVNFDKFIKSLDIIREKKGRISSTPNNPESSRSIIVYDMLIEIKVEKTTRKVPFVIVDLPGREEIIESYVDTYLKKYFMINLIGDQEYLYKLFLSSLCLNPLGLAVVCPGDVFNFFNTLDDKTRKFLFSGINDEEGGKFKTGGINKIKNYINFSDTNFKFILKKIRDGEPILGLPQYSAYNSNDVRADGKVDTDLSKQTTGCLVALRRVIEKGKLDILSNLTKHLADKFINNKLNQWKQNNITTDDNKKEFIIGQIIDPTKNYNNIDKDQKRKLTQDLEEKLAQGFNLDNEVDKKLKFNYFNTPYEGVYINENINGLVKYLAKLVDDNENKIKTIIPEQDQELDFTKEKDYIKIQMRKEGLYLRLTEQIQNSNTDFVYKETHVESNDGPAQGNYYVYRVKEGWKDLYNRMKNQYKSDRIFRYEYPFMEQILEYYKRETNDDDFKKNIKKVTDYKVFYLFSNTSIDLKCKHQIELLDKTKNFIKALEN